MGRAFTGTATRERTAVRIVHEGRGGYIELDAARYPIEHVDEGRFVVHWHTRAPRAQQVAHREALEQLVREMPEKWAIEARTRKSRPAR